MAGLIIDTTAWSLFLRRRDPARLTTAELAVRDAVDYASRSGEAILLGPVRQEVLNGLTPEPRFFAVRDVLRAFPDERLSETDHERAAEMFTRCKQRGIQGSDVDFLVCAVAERRDVPILTTDQDFVRYASVLPVRLQQLP